MRSWFLWGIGIAVTPIALPFLFWPAWWLAGCQPRGQAVYCQSAEWYSSIALAINSVPWLMFITFPIGFVLVVVGIVKLLFGSQSGT
jgi:hypothetical protein